MTTRAATWLNSLLWCLFLLLAQYAHAQRGMEDAGHWHYGYQCASAEVSRFAIEGNPERKARFNEVQADIARLTATAQMTNNQAGQIDYIVPVVVHIMHNFGPENISDAQIFDAIRVLNEDFQIRNRDTGTVSAPFKSIIGNAKMRFVLARLDPQGKCTNGITRTATPLANIADDNVKDLVSWDTKRYLNIWVVGSIAFGAGGYAYYPGTPPDPRYEGVVCNYRQFGSIGTSSGNFAARTLTHEVGHYLNLKHTWGDTNSPGFASNCNWDDDVQDTPNTIGVSDQGCRLNFVSCGLLSNVENYMDYSNCGRMFSAGQAARMTAALRSGVAGRNQLWTAANLIRTGVDTNVRVSGCAPRVTFSVPTLPFCVGSSVSFSAQVFNVLQGDTTLRYKWSFDGGIATNADRLGASAIFSTPGLKSVKFVATNKDGGDSLEYISAVNIIDTTAGVRGGTIQSFEATDAPVNLFRATPQNWIATNSTGGGWQVTNNTSFQGSASLIATTFGEPAGSISSLLSPIIVPAGIPSSDFICSFAIAYHPLSATESPALRMSISTDCGATWRVRQTVNAASLRTSPSTAPASWVPSTATDWRVVNVSLSNFSRAPQFQLRFDLVAGGANTVYLDQIVFAPITSIEASVRNQPLRASLIPNPSTTASLKLQGDFIGDKPVGVSVFTVNGQLLGNHNVNGTDADGTYDLSALAQRMKPGAYMLKISQGSSIPQMLKLVLQ